MATFDSVNIEFTFIDNPNSWVFSYSGMPLSSSFPEASQIQLRYEAVQVYSGGTAAGGGVLVSLSDLTPALQEQIRVLSTDLYVVDATTHKVTVQDLSNQQANVTGLVETYFYAPSAAPSGLTPLRIRRSTDINTAVITYQPGARLTSDVLNATTAQLLNATQELTAFGQSGSTSGGGSSGTPDLSGNILDDIGDVNTPTGTGPLMWNESATPGRWTVGSSGNFVPPGDTLDSNHVLRKASTVSGDYEWWDIVTSTDGFAGLVTNISANSTGINANTSAITTLQTKTQNITATSTDTTIANDLNVGDDIVAADDITAGGSIAAGGSITGSNIYSAHDSGTTRLGHTGSTGNTRAFVFSDASTGTPSGYYIGSQQGPALPGRHRTYAYGATSGQYYESPAGLVMHNRYDGSNYFYNALGEGTTNATKIHAQFRPAGYSYISSSYDAVGSSHNYVLTNPQGAQLNRDGNGGSEWWMQTYVNNMGVALFGNRGQIYLRPNGGGATTASGNKDQIIIRPNVIGDQNGGGAGIVVIGMYDDSVWTAPNTYGAYRWYVDSTGRSHANGFTQLSDASMKTFLGNSIAPGADNRGATAKLAALSVQTYRYNRDANTADPTSPIQYGFSAADLIAQGLDTYGIVQTQPVIAAETITGVNPSSEGDNDNTTPGNETTPGDAGNHATIDLMSLQAVTVQAVGELDTRTSALEAAPSSGIQSNAGTGGTGSVAITNMVTIPTGAYGQLSVPPNTGPNAGTIYFLT